MAENGKNCALDLFHVFLSTLETKVVRFYGLSLKCIPFIMDTNYPQFKISIQDGDREIAAGPSSETGGTIFARHRF